MTKERGKLVMDCNDSITVLTTAEHTMWFKSVLGDGADYRYDPRFCTPLEDFLSNVTVAGGTVVLLDEAFFLSADILAQGIAAYVDSPARSGRSVRIIVVCPDREPGDEFLRFLASYCQVYDVVFGTAPDEVSDHVERLLSTPNSRRDVMCLMKSRNAPIVFSERRPIRTVAGKSLVEERAVLPGGIKVLVTIEAAGA